MRREWVEIYFSPIDSCVGDCLSPCGESGLKLNRINGIGVYFGLSPCGESGLK